MTDFFENIRLWEVLGWTMLNFLWMGCLLFVLSAGVRYAVRRSSPAVRYCTALLCLLAVTATAVGALFISLQQVEGLVAASELDPVQPDLDVAGTPPLHLNWMREGLTPAEPQPPANDRHTPADALRHEVFHGALRTCAGILPWLWICGTPFVALALLTGVIGTTRLRRRSNAVSDEPLLRQVQRLRTLLGISRRVGIAVCDQVSSPLVIGVLRPLIVLPPSIVSGLAPAQLEMILLHELAHVRRWDNLVNLLQRTIEALLFYHPVVWW